MEDLNGAIPGWFLEKFGRQTMTNKEARESVLTTMLEICDAISERIEHQKEQVYLAYERKQIQKKLDNLRKAKYAN